jgi:hypothetical protein
MHLKQVDRIADPSRHWNKIFVSSSLHDICPIEVSFIIDRTSVELISLSQGILIYQRKYLKPV